ncbi:hypothetical protein [Sulfurimonas paralvinellae]|uniref:Uncharacterized protein n=1 Tax=Sulfurimonas paralvinellae TaxID=317658 RepID=A0A7M1B6N2_9BACT|nr:hypothetical protein [Sulfurimonas paralvinellae]QOP45166.1 hypothetical protein FM071_02220 [Sulfurimonas paralvinellae]
MFIASYATFIPTVATIKPNNSIKESFSHKSEPVLLSEQKPDNTETKLQPAPQPLSTAAKYSLLWQQEQNPNLQELEKVQKRQKAKTAYKESVTPFSYMKKPKVPLQNSYFGLHSKFPKETQVVQHTFLKEKMLNTYIENDNYYRVTAA